MSLGRRRALLIGNSRFADEQLAPLFAPSADVKALHGVLADPQIGDFKVDILVDEPLEKARREIAALCVGASANDVVLIYYTGHGVLNWHGDLHLAFERTTKDLPEADGLEASWVKSRLDQSKASRQALILDCCHSGAVIHGKAGHRPAVTADTFGKAPGRYILTACDKMGVAYDGTDGLCSLFTALLVEGLKNGVGAKDKEFIAIPDLYHYVCTNRPNDGRPMSPNFFGASKEGAFALARNPAYLRYLQEEAEIRSRNEEEKQRQERELEERKAQFEKYPDYNETKLKAEEAERSKREMAEEAERLRRELREARESEEKRKIKMAHLDGVRKDIAMMKEAMISFYARAETRSEQEAANFFEARLQKALDAEEREDYRKALELYKEMAENIRPLFYHTFHKINVQRLGDLLSDRAFAIQFQRYERR